MDRETLKQKINYEINLRNSNFTLAVITITGTLGLFLNLKTIKEFILFVLGLILTFGFLNGTFKKDGEIEKLIKLHERTKE